MLVATQSLGIVSPEVSFRPPVINFLLPLDNHDRLPPGKRTAGDAVYGDWLRRAFDRWVESPISTKVLFFNSVINLLCGKPALTESHGLGPVDLIVIETNGDREAVDSLKAAYEGAARLGLNVYDHDLDQAAGTMFTTRRPRFVPNSTAPADRANSVSSLPMPTPEPGWKWVPRWRTMISPALTT